MSDFPLTRAAIEAGVEQGLHTGAQIFVARGDAVLLEIAIGTFFDRPAQSDDLMLWMSAGKPITAIAFLQCVTRGEITLDQPVERVLPSFAQNGKVGITPRHLLTHTAGFRGPLNNFTPGSWQQILERVFALRQEPGWVPGEKAGYHIGSSWFVLAALVEACSGQSISTYVRDYIFEPLGATDAFLGMSDTDFHQRRERLVPVIQTAPGAMPFSGDLPEQVILPRPGANCRGPIGTLGRVYQSLLCDQRLLPTHLKALMRSRQRDGMFDETFKQNIDWGLGVLLDSKHRTPRHAYGYGPFASPDTFGHSGNQIACGFADPQHDLAVAWACNGMPGEPLHQARQSAINAAIYRDLDLANDT